MSRPRQIRSLRRPDERKAGCHDFLVERHDLLPRAEVEGPLMGALDLRIDPPGDRPAPQFGAELQVDPRDAQEDLGGQAIAHHVGSEEPVRPVFARQEGAQLGGVEQGPAIVEEERGVAGKGGAGQQLAHLRLVPVEGRRHAHRLARSEAGHRLQRQGLAAGVVGSVTGNQGCRRQGRTKDRGKNRRQKGSARSRIHERKGREGLPDHFQGGSCILLRKGQGDLGPLLGIVVQIEALARMMAGPREQFPPGVEGRAAQNEGQAAQAALRAEAQDLAQKPRRRIGGLHPPLCVGLQEQDVSQHEFEPVFVDRLALAVMDRDEEVAVIHEAAVAAHVGEHRLRRLRHPARMKLDDRCPPLEPIARSAMRHRMQDRSSPVEEQTADGSPTVVVGLDRVERDCPVIADPVGEDGLHGHRRELHLAGTPDEEQGGPGRERHFPPRQGVPPAAPVPPARPRDRATAPDESPRARPLAVHPPPSGTAPGRGRASPAPEPGRPHRE